MAEQLELFENLSPLDRQLIALDDDGCAYAQALLEMLFADPFVIRKMSLNGSIIASQYAHLRLDEAAQILIGDNSKPARLSAWVLAMLMAQVRPPQQEATILSPILILKRRSGHQAREPPNTDIKRWLALSACSSVILDRLL